MLKFLMAVSVYFGALSNFIQYNLVGKNYFFLWNMSPPLKVEDEGEKVIRNVGSTYQVTRRYFLEYSSLLIRPNIRCATVGYVLSCFEL
jgi:hypothetical protein